MVRAAREEKLPPEMGLCKLCGQGMEDVRHLLLSCSAHANQRARGVDRGLEMADIAPLSEQSEVDQLDLLLGKTTGLLEADDRINRCVARFLKKAWRSREWLTASLNAKLGRIDTIWALGAQGAWRPRGPAGSSGVARPSGAHVMGWAAPWIEAHRGRFTCPCVPPL